MVAANIVSCYIGVQKDFLSSANFTIWCNVSLTAAAAVACAPQIRTLFIKRFRQLKPQREAGQDSIMTTQDERRQSSPEILQETVGSEKRSKHTPLILSNKFLSGDGKVGVGDVRLSKNRPSGEHEIV